jgi:hypothetical protein
MRLAAVGALLLSALALTASPAAAAVPASGSVTPNPNGTATISYADTTSVQLYINDNLVACDDTGSAPTTTPKYSMSGPPVGTSPFTVGTSTTVNVALTANTTTLPTGAYYFCLYDVTGGSTWTLLSGGSTVAIFTPVTASIADDGNGSLVLTYADANVDFSQMVYVFLFTGMSTCPSLDAFSPTAATGFAFQYGLNITDSPMTIGVGTSAQTLPGGLTGTVTAGDYLSCLYLTVEYSDALQQSLPISIHPPVEPVTPTFTG